MKKIPLLIVLVAGCILALLIRLMLIPNPGFEADVAFWKSWSLAVVDFGIVKGLSLTNFNYPTPFGYFLGLLAKAYSVLADPHDYTQFWMNNNLLFLFVSKLPAIIADFGIAGVILYIGKHAKKLGFPPLSFSFYSLLSLFYLLNPVSLIDGALWGQIDSVGVFLFLLALLFLLRRMSFIAGIIFMIAMMTKLQNMIYGPIFFLLVWQLTGLTGLARAAAGALTGFAGTNIEFILTHNFSRVIESLTGNYDAFPWVSLNAFNPWWIYSGAAGMKVSDKILVLGLVNAKTLGLYLFSGAYLFAVLRQLTAKSEQIRFFLESFIVVNGAFFLFQTESHDRYAFPLTVMLLLWGVFFLKANRMKLFTILYSLFSLFYFYNLHTALVFNYPANGLPGLSALTAPWLTISVSFIFTGAFLWFLLWLARDSYWSLIPPIALISLILITKNPPLLTKQPVYLNTLTPTEHKQDYGSRVINMPTNASGDFSKWGSLSVQYAFYRHGIGTHANSHQTYHLGALFKTFSFDYGVETRAGPRASVTFEVWGLPAGKAGDDTRLFASQKITKFEYPRHADVDVAGVSKLKLVVTDAGDGITDDHANWLNPKLIP